MNRPVIIQQVVVNINGKTDMTDNKGQQLINLVSVA
jgi:hypothetical protein